MALRTQQLAYPLVHGPNDEVDDVIKGQQLIDAENVVYLQHGRVQKRQGFVSRVSETFKNHNTLITNGDSMAYFDSQEMYSYTSAAGEVLRAPAFPVKITTAPITRDPGGVKRVDSAYYSGYFVYLWENVPPSGAVTNIIASVVDETSGNVVLGPRVLASTAAQPMCVTVGSSVICLYTDSTNDLNAYNIDFSGATPTWGSETQIVAAIGNITEPDYDACEDPNNDVFFVVYRNSSSQLECKKVSEAKSVTGTYTDTGTDPAYHVACHCLSQNSDVVLAYATASGVDIDARQIESTGMTSVQVTTACTGTTNDYKRIVIFEESSLGTTSDWYFVGGQDPSDTGTNHPQLLGAEIQISGVTAAVKGAGWTDLLVHSKPFLFNDGASSDSVMPCVLASCPLLTDDTQPHLFVVALYGGGVWTVHDEAPSSLSSNAKQVVARVQSDVGDPTTDNHHLPRVHAIATNKFHVALRRRLSIESIASGGAITYHHGADAITIDYSQSTPQLRAELGSNTYIAGGTLQYYDGQFLSENTPHYFPVITTAAETASGSLANGTYSYKAVYEWEDRGGLLHRSAPSAAAAVTTVGGFAIDVTVATLLFQQHRAEYDSGTNNDNTYRIVLYRTKASGTTYYRVMSADMSTTAQNKITFNDATADADLSDNELLYTTGGILPNDPPPACVDVAVGNERVWLIDAQDPRRLWFSKPLKPGLAPEFSTSLTLMAPANLVAVEVIDDKTVCFASDRIYVFAGAGPDATAAGTFSPIADIEAPVGCKMAQSVVKVAGGIMFQSKRGIEMLDRSMRVVDPAFGLPTRTKASGSDLVIGALHHAKFNRVYFIVNATDNDQVIVYDARHGLWSHWDLQFASLTRVRDHGFISNNYFLLAQTSTTGELYEQIAGAFDDAGAHFAMRVQTPYFKLGSILGYGRCRSVSVLYDYHETTQLTITANYDYPGNSQGTDSATFTDSTLSGANNYKVEWRLPTQKMAAVSFVIEDVQSGGTTDTKAVSLHALELELGLKPGPTRLPATTRK